MPVDVHGRPSWTPNPWVERWRYSMPSTRDHIVQRQKRIARAPLFKVVSSVNLNETYECGHTSPVKKDPAGQPYRSGARRCLECLRVNEDYAVLLGELGLK